MVLNNEWVNNEMKEEIKKFLEMNENKHSTVQTFQDTAKAVLRGKFIVIQASLKQRIFSNKQPNHTFTRPGGATINKA